MPNKKESGRAPRRTYVRRKRRAIVDGAYRVFVRDGYSGAAVEDIAREADVSKRTLYQYFRSKEEMFDAIIREECEQILAPIAIPNIEDAKPRDSLLKLAHSTATLTVRGRGPGLYRLVAAEAERFPRLAKIFVEHGPQAGVVQLASYFRHWTATGELKVANPEWAAELFFGMVNTLRAKLLLGVAPVPGEREMNEWVDLVVNVFLSGIESAPIPKRKSTRGSAQ